MCIGGLTERQMLQLALEESKNAALAAKAAAGKSDQSSDEDDSDCDSGDGSSAYGARASAGKARRAKAKQKSLTQKAAGALREQAFSPCCCHRTLLLHMLAGEVWACIIGVFLSNLDEMIADGMVKGGRVRILSQCLADHVNICSTPRKRARLEGPDIRTATSSENSKASRSTQLRDLVSSRLRSLEKGSHCAPMSFRLWEDILVCFNWQQYRPLTLTVQVASLATPF